MNIHLMSNDKFAAKFVWLIDNMYQKGTNIVYIHSNVGKEKNIKSNNVRYIDSFKEVDFGLLNSGDKLFVHGFYNTALVRFLCFHSRKIDKNQLVLIVWGADLYDARAALHEPGVHLKIRINESFKRRLIKRCNKFMTFACADFDLICKWYGACGKQFDCIYPTNADIGLLDELMVEKKGINSDIKVLLGNSATLSNQHISALDQLKKFSNEKMRIVCPLSYGDMEYAKEVIEYGKKLFGDDFIPIKEFMSSEDYSKLLNSVDIAVFYNNRQQATGNIEILAYLGKKIYIRSDTTTWKHYVERDECAFYDALNIKSLEYDDFINNNRDGIDYNHNYIKKVWDVVEIKRLWDEVMRSK